jgi:DNA repair exonuclease SbcCD nuclease subunit
LKVAVITDTHFGVRNDSLIFSKYIASFFDTVFFPYLKEHNINHVIHMGDVFDRRKYINFKTLYDAKKYFFDPLIKNNITVDMIAGNHDTFYKTTNEVNSVDLLLQEYSNIQRYSEPTELENCILMPWICRENYDDAMNAIKNTKHDLMFGHFEIRGFEMHKGAVCIEGIDTTPFNKFDMVFSGHFHHKSDNGTIYYTGNPYQLTWQDYKAERGFHIFDFETRDIEFVANPYTMFHKFFYDDSDIQPLDVEQLNFDQYENTYLKVIIQNKTNPYVFDLVMDKIYKADVHDVTVVETFLDEDIDVDIVDEAKDTLTILNDYIDQMNINVNKPKLTSLMSSLYNEALTVE